MHIPAIQKNGIKKTPKKRPLLKGVCRPSTPPDWHILAAHRGPMSNPFCVSICLLLELFVRPLGEADPAPELSATALHKLSLWLFRASAAREYTTHVQNTAVAMRFRKAVTRVCSPRKTRSSIKSDGGGGRFVSLTSFPMYFGRRRGRSLRRKSERDSSRGERPREASGHASRVRDALFRGTLSLSLDTCHARCSFLFSIILFHSRDFFSQKQRSPRTSAQASRCFPSSRLASLDGIVEIL